MFWLLLFLVLGVIGLSVLEMLGGQVAAARTTTDNVYFPISTLQIVGMAGITPLWTGRSVLMEEGIVKECDGAKEGAKSEIKQLAATTGSRSNNCQQE